MLLLLWGAAGCGATPQTSIQAAALSGRMPSLPYDTPAYPHQAAGVNAIPGAEYIGSSGPPAVHIHDTFPSALTLDGQMLSGPHDFAWAMWRLQLGEDVVVDEIRINTMQSVDVPYYACLANYTEGHWQFEYRQNSGILDLPDETALHSPGNSVYVAVVVMSGNKVNIASFDITTSGGTGEFPIFDDFEPNDPMESAWHMEPGFYHASIHETYVLEMGGRDKMDFYTVSLTAGQHLTTTLFYEPYDHFFISTPENPFPNYNDLDVLIYPPGSTMPYDEFIEDASGLTIYYYAADQGYYQVTASGDYIIGILGEIEGPDNNAEYDLGIYVSDNTYSVSGQLTQLGGEIDKAFLVFLDTGDPANPGNFNTVATIDTDPHGAFTIRGVPNGSYTLKVRSSAAFYPYGVHPWTWDQTLPVTVAGGDVTGANIDIGADPEP